MIDKKNPFISSPARFKKTWQKVGLEKKLSASGLFVGALLRGAVQLKSRKAVPPVRKDAPKKDAWSTWLPHAIDKYQAENQA